MIVTPGMAVHVLEDLDHLGLFQIQPQGAQDPCQNDIPWTTRHTCWSVAARKWRSGNWNTRPIRARRSDDVTAAVRTAPLPAARSPHQQVHHKYVVLTLRCDIYLSEPHQALQSQEGRAESMKSRAFKEIWLIRSYYKSLAT